MIRLDNWQSQLSDKIRERASTPFDIVTFNCLMWACEAIEAQTGENLYAPFADKFKTSKGAKRQLKYQHVETAEDYIKSKLGEPLNKLSIVKGDIVAVDPDTDGLDLTTDLDLFGRSLGVCYGHVTYFVGELGLIAFPTLQLGSNTHGFPC